MKATKMKAKRRRHDAKFKSIVALEALKGRLRDRPIVEESF